MQVIGTENEEALSQEASADSESGMGNPVMIAGICQSERRVSARWCRELPGASGYRVTGPGGHGDPSSGRTRRRRGWSVRLMERQVPFHNERTASEPVPGTGSAGIMLAYLRLAAGDEKPAARFVEIYEPPEPVYCQRCGDHVPL